MLLTTQSIYKRKKNLGKVIVTEGIVTEKWKPRQDVFEKLNIKEFLQKVEAYFQISTHLLHNTIEMNEKLKKGVYWFHYYHSSTVI